ncbi:MAG: CHC2 zinc finger domain-containing protein [Caulobacterales bacterium]|uniref:CHC2 zinc finger domain-containing protein n=1 Tax=Glycocaulis sp. TaxID=1969725 RepID=UPI003FA01770
MTADYLIGEVGRADTLNRRDRAQAIKDAIGIDDVAEALGSRLQPHAEGWLADCPDCKGEVTAKISAHGEHFHCTACRGAGDVIGYVRAARGTGFGEACRWLEGRIEGKAGACDKTGELFG